MDSRIAADHYVREERNTLWKLTQNALEASIIELQRKIHRLEQEINFIANVEAAERAAEARKNSWGTWLLSPFYKQVEVSEMENARKDRDCQERKIEKDMKERRLSTWREELLEKEFQREEAKMEFTSANAGYELALRFIEIEKQAREIREKQQKEQEERERLPKIRREQEEQQAKVLKQQRDKAAQKAREGFMKAQVEAQAAAAREDDFERLHRHLRDDLHSHFTYISRQSHRSVCGHGGWWDKVHQRTICPKCHDVWDYLLQCPRCQTKACPRCQSDMRPKFPRHPKGTSRRGTLRQPPAQSIHIDRFL